MGRKSSGDNYRPGSFYRVDDRSGFTVRAGDTRKEWTQAIVDQRLWEPRQPQDFVRGVPDNQTVPDPRSIPPPLFNGPIMTTLSAAVAVGATFLPLASTFGFTDGGRIGLMLDSGSYFNTTISGAPTGGGVNIATPAPNTAASGNIVTAYEASGP